jgi:hypothetical protein
VLATTLRVMAYNTHPDDQPPAEAFRPSTEEDVRNHLPEDDTSMQDPVALGIMFCDALDEYQDFPDVLARLVTPESLEAWGDFSEASAGLARIGQRGYGSNADRAMGDNDVAYFKIFSGVNESFRAIGDQIISAAAIVTMVWRPELGEWRVHQIGNYAKPEDVPRAWMS